MHRNPDNHEGILYTYVRAYYKAKSLPELRKRKKKDKQTKNVTPKNKAFMKKIINKRRKKKKQNATMLGYLPLQMPCLLVFMVIIVFRFDHNEFLHKYCVNTAPIRYYC